MIDVPHLGEEALDRYAESGDPTELDAAIGHLQAALDSDPGHESALWWAHCLGLAYAERGDRADAVADHDRADALADYDRAVALLTEVVASLDRGSDRDVDVVVLIDAWWERTRISGHGAEHAAAVIGSLSAELTDETLAAYARVVQGLALLAVYDETEHRPDLKTAVGVLSAALESLTPEAPRYIEASAWLCLALRQLDDLNRSIDVGRRAADRAAPDDPSLPLLIEFLAESYQDRWDDGETDPEDLGQAIVYWQRLIEVEPTDNALTECGRLMRERAERGQDMADAREAVRLLELAVRMDADDVRWFQLARACHAGWKIGRDRSLLERAVHAADQAVAEHDATDDLSLWLHLQRITVWNAQVEDEAERLPTQAPPSAEGMGRCVAEARAAWEAAGDRADPDTSAMLATMLALGEMQGGRTDLGSVDIDRVAFLAALGRTVTDPPAGWTGILDSLDAGVQFVLDAQRGGQRDGGLTPLIDALNAPGIDAETQAMVDQLMPVVLFGNASRSGDRRVMQAALNRMLTAGLVDPDSAVLARVLDLMDRTQHGENVAGEVRRLAAELRESPPSHTAQQAVAIPLRMLQGVYDGMSGHGRAVDRTPLPHVSGLEAGMVIGGALAEVFGPFSAAVTRHDLAALRECAARFAEIAAAASEDDTMQFVVTLLAGVAELAVVRNDRTDQDAATRATEWLARGEAIAGGPQHPSWATAAMSHGEAMRSTPKPDLTRSRELGMSAMRGFAWQVLLQSGTDDAVAVAAQASAEAMKVAAWCRADGAYDDLVTALDAGRGLVLHAATASRTVADRLVDAGREDLAERWRESAGFGRDARTGASLNALSDGPEVPDDLRTLVLHALGAHDPVRGGPFTPVRPPEIRRALTEVRADALVYLVPAALDQPGAAVFVPVSGDVATVILPDLVTGPSSMVSRLAAAAQRDAGEVGAQVTASSGPSVDDVCRWAWSVAIGPVLRHAERWQLGRPVRLVLVPMGLLATVPWHGAFRQDGQGRHWAVERAVFSYAVSARSLCTSSTFPQRPMRSVLVIGDPGGDLSYAGLEARAIRDAFYPGCTYLGRPAGTGTPSEVLDWIAAAAPGPSLLHFACHGRVDPRSPADAHLVLAGGMLTARRLLDASRTAELVMERVFLAACTTGVTGADHDEAFSLSTAFLAAGARTVFGSLWSVPDAETSMLMFLVHHFLNAEACAPADALHRAQLWMLDPSRRPPPGMPADLAAHCESPALADPASWAAFHHMGR
ncbi:CHAT domain-containing protein [Micromonospora sp. NPDC053740]|uniref:CHAT domain-containing protein n=1 Tax=Micromonospora sp. NPDC053740 TaxID=3155173 RepID=UPI00344186EC